MEISVDLTKVEESAATINALGTRIERALGKVPAWRAFSYEGYGEGDDQTKDATLEIKGFGLKINGKTLIIARKQPQKWTAGFPDLKSWPKETMAVVQDESGLRPATGQDLTAAETVLGNLPSAVQTG